MTAKSLPSKLKAPKQNAFLQRVQPDKWENPAPKEIYDLIVIGAGPGGLAAVDVAVEQGLSVALVERYRLGGNSLNFGSIPSKAMIRTSRVLETIRDAESFGAPTPEEPSPDFAAVMMRMDQIRSRIAEYHSAQSLCAMGVDVFFGAARFQDCTSIHVNDKVLVFRKAVVATGARPKPSNIKGLEAIGYLTSATIFDLKTLPKRLAIIGGGPLGCELAQAFCRLGSHVIIVQNEPKFLPHEERDAAELLSMSLSRDGVETRLNTTVVGGRIESGLKGLDTTNNGVKEFIPADQILLSIGRIPNVEELALEAAGVDCDLPHGIKVDDFLRTTNPNIYAAGDVCMPHKFANIAEASSRMAVQNAFGSRKRYSRLIIPWCTFCSPEIAHVGMHIWEARQKSIPIKTYTVMMHDVDRAITDGQDDGFVKIHVQLGTDKILGATIVASRASDMINEMSVIMSARIGMRRLAGMLHTYPAQSEAIRLAAMAFIKDQPVDNHR